MTSSLLSSIEKPYRELEQRLLDYFVDESQDDQCFNQLALDVFCFQYQHNQPYQQWCQHLDIKTPSNISRWQDIPAVPTSAFKDSGLKLNCFPKNSLHKVFKTSGTTSDQHRRGEHGFHSTRLYSQSILAAWKQLKLPEDLPYLFLTQSSQNAAHSSLSFMMMELDSSQATLELDPFYISADGQLDLSRLVTTCQSLDQPVMILGTALAFLKLCEKLKSKSIKLPLPTGSALLETGGYKGSRRTLEKSVFYQNLKQFFNIPPERIFNEYSMTELSSQFYTSGLNRPHLAPHWTRIQIIDPETRKSVSPGQTGHLQILDLANLGSVASIRTEDLAIAGESPQSFQLLGRDPSALPRGCSRSADEMLNS